MSSCENSNKKLMFFGTANYCSKMKSIVFLMEIEKKNIRKSGIAAMFLLKFEKSLA